MRNWDVGVGASIPNHGSYFCSKLEDERCETERIDFGSKTTYTDRSSWTSCADKIPVDAKFSPELELKGFLSFHAMSLATIAIGVPHATFPRPVKNDSEFSNEWSHS